MQITNLDRPIGLTALNNGNVVVGVSGSDEVRIYDKNARLIMKLKPKRPFRFVAVSNPNYVFL